MEVDADLLITVLVTIVVALWIFYLGISTGKPKLIIGGGSSGGGGRPDSVHHTSIGIMNDPNFFGIRLERSAAKIVHAFLRDKTTKDIYVLPSNWQVTNASDISSETSIEAGERKNLTLFVQIRNRKEYFICTGKADEIANNAERFSDTEKEFTLIIRDSVGREYKHDLFVVNKGQSIHIRTTVTLTRRLGMIREGFSQILRAFKPGKFG